MPCCLVCGYKHLEDCSASRTFITICQSAEHNIPEEQMLTGTTMKVSNLTLYSILLCVNFKMIPVERVLRIMLGLKREEVMAK